MKQKCALLLLFIIFISFTNSEFYFGNSNPEKMVFLFHGHGASCDHLQPIADLFTQAGFRFIFCVNSGEGDDSVFVPLRTQIQRASDHIFQFKNSEEYRERFQQGVYFVGVSQGGIIARMVFNVFDEISNYVNRIITIGSPNAGLAELKILDSDFKNAVINYIVTSWVGRKYSAANFYMGKSEASVSKSTVDTKDIYYYLNCAFDHSLLDNMAEHQFNQSQMDDIILFIERCAQIKFKYSNLEMFITIMFVHDQMINPDNSAIFHQPYQPVQPQLVMFQNRMRLKNLESQMKAANVQYVNAVKQQTPQIRHFSKLQQRYSYLVNMYTFDVQFMENYLKANPDLAFSAPFDMQSTEFYKHDIINLRKSIENGRYLSCAIHRPHTSLNNDEFIHMVIRPLTLSTPRLGSDLSDQEMLIATRSMFINYELISPLRLFCDFDLITPPQVTKANDTKPGQSVNMSRPMQKQIDRLVI